MQLPLPGAGGGFISTTEEEVTSTTGSAICAGGNRSGGGGTSDELVVFSAFVIVDVVVVVVAAAPFSTTPAPASDNTSSFSAPTSLVRTSGHDWLFSTLAPAVPAVAAVVADAAMTSGGLLKDENEDERPAVRTHRQPRRCGPTPVFSDAG